MWRKRISFAMLIGLALIVVGVVLAPAEPVKFEQGAQKPDTEIVQTFPTGGPAETAWKVQWGETRGYGLYIQGAWFKRGPDDRWLQVLGDARVSEIFVPYHAGTPRFWDVSYNFPLCTVTKADAGPNGKLLRSAKDEPPRVVQEIRDRGVIWKDTYGVRRGQMLLLWGTLEAANYRYIIEYGFCDDGSIRFRLGATGYNYPGSEWEPHMHNGLWRIDVNLDGPNNNSVYLVEHIEPDGNRKTQARTDRTPFNGGKEGFADFNANKFTMLRVVHEQKKNKRNQPLAYDLVPLRMGNARHYGGERGEEACTQHDFWVTKAKANELIYTDLPRFVDGESVMNTDVCLWHSSAMHHEPRSEDGEFQGADFVGCTHVCWAGVWLRPRDVFDRTPLYPYKK